MIKKYPILHGACIDNFHKLYNADLYEQYDILNYEDPTFRLKIEVIATEIYNTTKNATKPYYKEFYVKNVYNFIWKLNIVVDSTFNFLSVFTPEVEFKYNYQNHIVEHAAIFINPLKFYNIDSLVSAIFHEIKHIFDHTITITNDIQQKEVLFRDYLVQEYQLYDKPEITFTSYNKNLIQNNESSIMEYFSSFIDYVASSEWTAYLENIDNSYKHELNNVKRIKFLKEKYPSIQIKKFMYFNIQSGNYLLIYYNIENYINDILELNLNIINKKYQRNFKDIYGVNTIQQVLKIYLKRIQKVKIRAKKIFNNVYKNSYLEKTIKSEQ